MAKQISMVRILRDPDGDVEDVTGVALGFVHWNGNIPSFVRWYKPPPAPIRPNTTVDAIIGGPAFGYVQGETQLCNFLCFG